MKKKQLLKQLYPSYDTRWLITAFALICMNHFTLSPSTQRPATFYDCPKLESQPEAIVVEAAIEPYKEMGALPVAETPPAIAIPAEDSAYIHRFQNVAIWEMEKFRIPASIKMAQALLESDAGASSLARKGNNHFGIKCYSRTCRPGHCMNKTDDSHKDFFRVYESAWAGWRAHSMLLQKERYKSLYKSNDYKTWAYGLKKAGYATDKKYAEKLIKVIEDYQLYRLDDSNLIY